MSYRLLIDLEVFEFIAALPRPLQLKLRRRLGELQETPRRFADYQENDVIGRSIDVHVYAGFALYYWEDFADRQIKVLRIRRADL
ncbi:MAG TPA: hypothetical protein VF614_08125 [Chthoniobacteraceae bacterium]